MFNKENKKIKHGKFKKLKQNDLCYHLLKIRDEAPSCLQEIQNYLINNSMRALLEGNINFIRVY